MHAIRWGLLVRSGRPFLLALLCVLSVGHRSGPAAAATCVPQPGAVAEPYVTNGASPQDRHLRGWPTLPSTAAVTFKRGTIRATRLEPSSARPIIRIWGGSAGVAGRFWSGTNPPTKRAFYGRSAVQYSWNSAEQKAVISSLWTTTSQAPPFPPIHVWAGLVANQPAQDTCGNILKGYSLPGGANQVWIPNAMPYIVTGQTPWSSPDLQRRARVETELAVRFPALVGQPRPEHFAALAARVDQLARFLDALGRGLDGHAELPIVQRQADELARISAQLGAATARLPDADAQQVARLLAAQLVGTARLIDDAVPLLEQHSQAASQMLDDIVDWAYRISAG